MPRVKPRPLPAAAPPLPDRPGRWKLIWRRQRRMLRPALLGLVLVVGVMAVAIGAGLARPGGALRQSALQITAGLGLQVRHITVDGGGKTPPEKVRAALGVAEGDPMLALSVSQARTRLEALTWVRAAVVERQLPDTIHVVLSERTPIAVWQNQGRFSLIDRAGNFVTDSDIAAFVDKLPLVVGIGAPKSAAALIDELAVQPDLAPRVVAAIRVGDRRWNLCMTSGADVMLPEGAEPQALARLAELQTTKALLDRPLQEIDLRLPDRLRLRPMTEGPCGSQPGPSPATLPRKAT